MNLAVVESVCLRGLCIARVTLEPGDHRVQARLAGTESNAFHQYADEILVESPSVVEGGWPLTAAKMMARTAAIVGDSRRLRSA